MPEKILHPVDRGPRIESERGGGVAEIVGPESVPDPGPTAESLNHAESLVAVDPSATGATDNGLPRRAGLESGGEELEGLRRQRDGTNLPTLAGDLYDLVPGLGGERLGGNGESFRYSQPRPETECHESPMGGRSNPSGGDHPPGLIGGEPEPRRLGRDPRATHKGGGVAVGDTLGPAVAVEAGNGGEFAGPSGRREPELLEVAGERIHGGATS